jgi:hypothetical protein
MKTLYRLFRHHGIYYAENTQTGKQQSLRTRDEGEARKLLHAKNEAAVNPLMNLALGKTYLAAHDPKLVTRTWAEVMADLTTHGRESSQTRSSREMRSKPYDLIRNKKLIETTAEDFKAVLAAGGASTNNYLRRLHNLALGLGWLPWPILPPKLWPKVRPKNKRGITREEHEKVVTAELNVERRLYYEMLWELGAAQTDTAKLTTENIDWNTRTVVYKRQKLDGSSEPACMSITSRIKADLETKSSVRLSDVLTTVESPSWQELHLATGIALQSLLTDYEVAPIRDYIWTKVRGTAEIQDIEIQK